MKAYQTNLTSIVNSFCCSTRYRSTYSFAYLCSTRYRSTNSFEYLLGN